jgi:RNA polymerase sigma-70 factor (ECF subfamily)
LELDEPLAERARGGDTAAFAVLVKRHEARVRRFLRRASGHAADDIAQEAFLKAWQRRGAWDGRGSYVGWLLRIAWTTFLDFERTDRRRAAREQHENEAAAPDPELALAVGQALAALAPRERAAAELCFAQGFSHGEAAAIMGLPLGTLKWVVARARQQLVALLENDDG